MKKIQLISVTYALDLKKETMQEIISGDLVYSNTPLPIKLKKLEKVIDVKYPIWGRSLKITIKVNDPKNIKLEPILWNKIINIIETHIKEK